jgi:hypothetical protein
VRRREADGAALEQPAQDALRADAPVVRVGAAEQLVDQKQRRDGPAREVDDLPQPGDLRVEARAPLLQRVVDPQRAADRQARDDEPAGADGRASCPTCSSR